MNVVLTRPPVEAYTQIQKRVDVALVAGLHAHVALGVLWLLAVVLVPICGVVVERPRWRLVVDVCHPFKRHRAD